MQKKTDCTLKTINTCYRYNICYYIQYTICYTHMHLSQQWQIHKYGTKIMVLQSRPQRDPQVGLKEIINV